MNATTLIILLLIGYIIYTIDKKQENFPVPPILVIIGIALSFIPQFGQIDITPYMIYHLFLPALLFISAYQFPFASLKKHAGIIVFLATAGILATVLLLGAVTYAISLPFIEITFVAAILIAAILTPTDPVSVVSILKKSSGNDKLANIAEGESLINDGTSIVIFTIVAALYTQNDTFGPAAFFGEFLYVSLGGAAAGALLGWLFSHAIHLTHNKEYQVMLSIILAYGAFNLAEHLGVSGVLATVFAGIMMSFEFGRAIKEDHFREALDGFWGIIEKSILSLLFLLIGIDAAGHLAFSYWPLAIAIFIASLLVRTLVITGTTQIAKPWRHDISPKESALLSAAGLKGAVSIFFILTIQATGDSTTDIIISLTFAAVLTSLIVQSFAIHPLSKKLSH